MTDTHPQVEGYTEDRAEAAPEPRSEPGDARPGAGGPRRRPRALPTALAALACFGVAFEFLAFQLSAGKDPALGAGTAAVKSQPARKRIVITKVVSSAPSVAGAPASGSSSAVVAAPAPVTTSSS